MKFVEELVPKEFYQIVLTSGGMHDAVFILALVHGLDVVGVHPLVYGGVLACHFYDLLSGNTSHDAGDCCKLVSSVFQLELHKFFVLVEFS